MSEHTIPELTKPLSRSKHWDVGVDWPLAGERAARLEREDQLREAFERIAKLEAERDDADEYLPAGPNQTLGERTKLLKDQMEYAAESSGLLGKALEEAYAENTQLRAALARMQQPVTDERIQAFWNGQAEWSRATFGTDAERGPVGPLKHLEKEAREAQDEPFDLVEKADCLFLIFDATRRSGRTLAELLTACEEKLAINKARTWNNPGPDGEPVEHVRTDGLAARAAGKGE